MEVEQVSHFISGKVKFQEALVLFTFSSFSYQYQNPRKQRLAIVLVTVLCNHGSQGLKEEYQSLQGLNY